MSGVPSNRSFQQNLNKWNTDKSDNGLSVTELKNAVDANKDNKIDVSELTAKGISPKEAEKIVGKIEGFKTSDKYLSMFGVKGNEKAQIVYNLFEMDEKTLPGGVEAVSLSDVQQGDKPVCYFLAAVGGLIQQRKDDVLKLIEKNKDGSFTVTFPGLDQEKKITIPMPGIPSFFEPKVGTIKNANKVNVKEPTEKEFEKGTHKGLNGSTWVKVLDKAYNEYCSKNSLRSNIPFFPKDKASDFGLPWAGIEVLTGNKAEHYFVGLNSDKTLLNDMNNALKKNKVVCACTILNGDKWPEKGNYKISNAHVYTVLSVDPAKKTITVRDPYGHTDSKDLQGKIQTDKSKNGVLTLPIDKFRDYFTDIAIETDKKMHS